MSSISSSCISPLSKQQASVLPDNLNANKKAMKLRKMIEELEKEKREYLKTNQHLRENTELIYQQNKALKDALTDRTTYYEHILDKYSQSEKTVKSASERSKKMSKTYHEYKNRAKNSQKDSESPFCPEEIEKFEQEIDDIQRSADELFKKYYESEKKMYDYKVLLSLDSRLTRINRILSNEAKNCITTKPELFERPKLNRLQQKVENGDEIKKELSIADEPDDDENDMKMEVTENALKKFSKKLDRCIQIYNQILLINRKKDLMDDDELDYSSFDENSRHSSMSNTMNNDDFEYKCAEPKVPKTVGFNDEILQLRRIVGIDGFGYLNDTEREDNYRRIKGLFGHGKNPQFLDSYDSSEPDKIVNKKNAEESDEIKQPEKVDDSNNTGQPLSVKPLQNLLDQPVNKSDKSKRSKRSDKNIDDSEKVDDSNNTGQPLSVKPLQNLLDQPVNKSDKSKKSKRSDKNIDDSEKVDDSNNTGQPLSVKPLQNLLDQPVNKSDKSKRSKHSEKNDDNSEKVDDSNNTGQPLSVKPLQNLLDQPVSKSDKSKISKHSEKNDDNSEKSNQLEKDGSNLPDNTLHPILNQPDKQHENGEDVDKPLKSDRQSEKANNPNKSHKSSQKDNNYSEKSVQTEQQNVVLQIFEHPDQIQTENVDQFLNTHPEKADDSEKNTKNSEKVEQPPLSVDPLKSLLVHPNQNKKSPSSRHRRKVTHEEHTSKKTKRSDVSIQSDLLEKDKNSKQSEKDEQQQKTNKQSVSLLVYPDKKRQQSNKKNIKNTTDEEERASEYILLEESGISNSEISNQTNQPNDNVNSKPSEKVEQQQKPNNQSVSLLVHPDKSRQKSNTKNIKNTTDEEERVSEYILLEESGISNSEISNQTNQPDDNANSKPSEKVEQQQKPNNQSVSLLVHPDKSRQKSNTKNIKNTTDEEERVSEYILLEESGISNSEISNQTNQPEQIDEQKPPEKQPSLQKQINQSVSLLVHPDKSRQRSNTNSIKNTTDEEERVSEYILLEESDFTNNSQPEKVDISIQSDLLEKDKNSKPSEKDEQQQKPNNQSVSLLVHPDKSRQKSNTKNIKNATDEEERVSEYILLEESGFSNSEIPIQTNQPEQNNEQKPPEKQPSLQKQINQSVSLLVHPDKTRQQSNTKNIKNTTDEEERVSEYLLLDESDFTNNSQPEKVDISIQSDLLDKTKDSKPTEKDEQTQKPNNQSVSLLVYPDKNRQQSSTKHIKNMTDEEERVSEYLLLDESGISNSEIPIQTNKPEQNNEQKPPEKQPSLQIQINQSVSLLVHPDKTRQQSNTKNIKNTTDEEERVSEYLLLDESGISNSEIPIQTNQPEQNNKPKPTEKVEQQQKQTNQSVSLLVHPNKNRQQLITNNQNVTEEERVSEYLLLDESEITDKSDQYSKSQIPARVSFSQPITKPNTSQTQPNQSVSLLVHPDKNRPRFPTTIQNAAEEEERESEYILLESEIADISENIIRHPTAKPKQADKSHPQPPQKQTNQSVSLLVRPTRPRQKPNPRNHKETKEDDELTSEFILLDESEIDNKCEIATQSNQLISTEKTEPIQKAKPPQTVNNSIRSLLVHPNKPPQKQQRNTSMFTIEEELDSEFLLLDESDPDPPKTETKQIQTEQSETEKKKATKTQKQKQERKSTYDPSIFYTNTSTFSKLTRTFSKCNDQVPLTVSLKDIGLEGLDSATLDKTQELKRIEEEKKALNKKNEDQNEEIESITKSDVVCKLVIFGPNTTSQKKGRLNVKPPSLLDSTQKAQKYQAIKPKVCQKPLKSNS